VRDTATKLWAHVSEPPPQAPFFDDVVQAALAKDPAQRLAGARAFERALRDGLRRAAEGRLEAAVTRATEGRREWQAAESELAGTVVALKAASESTSTGSRAHGLCPFKGLATFEFDDAGYFFGRERVVAELVARLVGARLLGIVGRCCCGRGRIHWASSSAPRLAVSAWSWRSTSSRRPSPRAVTSPSARASSTRFYGIATGS